VTGNKWYLVHLYVTAASHYRLTTGAHNPDEVSVSTAAVFQRRRLATYLLPLAY